MDVRQLQQSYFKVQSLSKHHNIMSRAELTFSSLYSVSSRLAVPTFLSTTEGLINYSKSVVEAVTFLLSLWTVAKQSVREESAGYSDVLELCFG